MRKAIYIVTILLVGCLFYACGDEAPTGETSQQEEVTNADTSEQLVTTNASVNLPCNITGEVMTGNTFFAKDAGIYIIIKADSSTADEELGPSHRILEVYDAACQLLQQEILPINRSADFPYYLAKINYNNTNQVIAIRGFNTIYLYDIHNRKLLPVLKPTYLTERMEVDAQSGRIDQLEVWEKYLIGYARDCGSFVFNISTPQKPEAVLPYAEYHTEEEGYHPLFLLPSGTNNYQIILPAFDKAEGMLQINPILAKPRPLKVEENTPSPNQKTVKFQLEDEASGTISIDLVGRKKVDVTN
jgi:hypothetical protein